MSEQKTIQHIAIIMDGNRRWATAKGMPKLLGHSEGAKSLKKVAKEVLKQEIPYLTLWALSTENIKRRSKEELKHLFSLFNKLTDYLDDFSKDDVKFNVIGDLETGIPEKTKEKLHELMEKTKNNKKMTLTLAVNYGGRDELTRMVKRVIDAGLKKDEVSEESVHSYLDTAEMPEVDLLIRTGGHHRLSGYLPWQSTYAELYFTDTFWPDFDEKELNKAIDWFHEQQRNRGK